MLDGLAGNERDVAAGNAEIAEFAVRKAAQFVDRLAVAAPVTVVADQVHRLAHLSELDGLTRDKRDVAAGDAEIGQFPVAQAAQLGNRFPVAAPVAVIADQVHGISRFVFGFVFSSFRSFILYEAKIGSVDSFLKRQ